MLEAERRAYEQGVEDERERWLPLWDAIKELEQYDPYLDGIEQEIDMPRGYPIAQQTLRLVVIALRSGGEK